MAAKLLIGKDITERLKSQLKREVVLIKKRGRRAPALSVVQVGDDKAEGIYIRSLAIIAKEIGINFKLIKLASSISQDKLIGVIKRLNKDVNVTAIMIGLPLSKGMDSKEILSYVEPTKNVERVNPTASAVMELIKSTGISLYGREAVVVGHGELVGKPIAMALLDKLATVTVCHIGTATSGRLKGHVNGAQVLVVAVGKPNVIKGSWIRRGAIVIDVGINKVGKRIVGDVEFESARKRASFITPVPGGVGPLTVVMLMRNCVDLFKKQNQGRFWRQSGRCPR